ncbi:hypothetical protein BDR07DRAFT_731617 [Suillus spraguei]|nr:hypothetical protein BDR07DRAFT_731617 [Suillus spraguei]
MPAIRRGGTYLDVSTTAHTPEGRLKLDKLRAGHKLAQQNAVCPTLLFICDENRNLGPANTLSISFEEFKDTMKSCASAANLRLGPCQHTYLRRVLLFFWEHGHIDLTFATMAVSEMWSNKSKFSPVSMIFIAAFEKSWMDMEHYQLGKNTVHTCRLQPRYLERIEHRLCSRGS